ncbi:MAG TPA: hypothetical protein VI251_17345 [Pseudolabrys sp.]|jgi:hypothetical protein
MAWYAYVAVFFAGAFAANGVPHFVQGICGNRFQTPFASPPGVGESSAIVNVVWGWVNFVVAGVLLHYFAPTVIRTPILFGLVGALGALLMALYLAHHFGKVRNSAPAP